MIKNKKASHVGMILSFLIFVTFLSFLYSVTQPLTKIKADKLDLLEFIKVELLKQFTEDVSTVTISTNTPSGSCFKLQSIPGLEDTGVVVKNLDGDIIDSYFEDSTDKTKIDEAPSILKLYYSKDFSKGTDFTVTCLDLGEGNEYNISLFKTNEELLETKIKNISESINENIEYYEKLKNDLGLSLEDNFGFTFNNGTKGFISGTNEKNISTDVYVEELPIQYMDNEANINPGFLNIKVW